LQLVVKILEREGYAVYAAPSGQSALEICEEFKNQIALVVSDVDMPAMSGIQLADCLSEFEKPVPIILMSGFSPENPLLERPLKSGRLSGYQFIHKPFVIKDLTLLVSTALDSHSN